MDFKNPTGSDIKQIISALQSAFPTYKKLKQMLHLELDKQLEQITANGSLDDVLYELIEQAKSEDWVEELLEGAYRKNPTNKKLNKLLGRDNAKKANSSSAFSKTYSDVEDFFKENRLDPILERIEQLYEVLSQREPKHSWLESSVADFERIRKKWDDRRFQVAVMALMKSGKSTLLNSWIGYEFLPSSTVPETMKMIKIRHTPDNPTGTLLRNNKVVAEGVKEINNYIHKINKEERTKNKLGVEEIKLNVELSTLKARKLNGYGFDFLDTPGFNEFGISSLPSKVERLVKNSDVIIYLLDVTKLKSNAEKEMLDNLKKWKIDIFKERGHRLFFVVNKIDTINRHDRENDMSIESIIVYVQNMLSENLEMMVEKEHIIPVSSELAILSRSIEKDIATDGQRKDFKEQAFGKVGSSFATDEMCKEAVPQILEESGFTELENKVLDTIYKNRTSILIDSVTSDLKQVLSHINNNLEIGRGALLNKIEDIRSLKQRIATFKTELDSINKESAAFKKKAIERVDKKFKRFKSTLKTLINEVFSQMEGTALKYPLLKFFTDRTNTATFELKSKDFGAFESTIYAINEQVIAHVNYHFKNLINVIINSQYSYFMNFREDIEKKSVPLLRKIEAEINETLKIELIPNNALFAPPSLDSFYDDIAVYLNDIITSETKSNMNWFQSVWHKFLKLLGLNYKEEVFHEVYKINSSDYREVIFSLLEPAIEQSKEDTINHVGSKYLATVNEAVDKIKTYADRYTGIIEEEIKAKKDGDIDIPLRIENLEYDIEDVNYLMRELGEVQATISHKR